ncbi:MAG: 2-oxoacid:acceptor oxidoreductase family protein [Thermodesulfobacteriota bacterium]
MHEIIFHGRGGQGAVTAVELIAQAAIAEGNYAQGFPSFGPERRGAPVMAFLRVSDDPIFSREKIETPDTVVVLDPTLLDLVDTCKGLKQGGTLIINSPLEKAGALQDYASQYRVFLVDATRIAMQTLGVPITNTAILGALVKATEIIGVHALQEPVEHRFGKLASKNLKALHQAFEETGMGQSPVVSADSKKSYADRSGANESVFMVDALHPWNEVEIGCDIVQPGSSAEFDTGNWRTTGKPHTDFEKCIKCGICWIMCPDMAYQANDEGFYDWDKRYCKGCGICVEECPKDAIEMREE